MNRNSIWGSANSEHVEISPSSLGVRKRTFREQDPVNIKASEMMGKLHDALKESGYSGHNLERFLVRLVFCLFADDTASSSQGRFLDAHRAAAPTRTEAIRPVAPAGSLRYETRRSDSGSTTRYDLAQFPYVRWGSLSGAVPLPGFQCRHARS